MERKSGGSTAAVTAAELSTALTRTKTLSSEEEKAVRMRNGARVQVGSPLLRVAGENEELGDELMLIEMQLLRAWKRQSPSPAPSRTKDKIVRALRKKR